MCLILFVVCVLNEKECCYWKEGERERDWHCAWLAEEGSWLHARQIKRARELRWFLNCRLFLCGLFGYGIHQTIVWFNELKGRSPILKFHFINNVVFLSFLFFIYYIRNDPNSLIKYFIKLFRLHSFFLKNLEKVKLSLKWTEMIKTPKYMGARKLERRGSMNEGDATLAFSRTLLSSIFLFFYKRTPKLYVI